MITCNDAYALLSAICDDCNEAFDPTSDNYNPFQTYSLWCEPNENGVLIVTVTPVVRKDDDEVLAALSIALPEVVAGKPVDMDAVCVTLLRTALDVNSKEYIQARIDGGYTSDEAYEALSAIIDGAVIMVRKLIDYDMVTDELHIGCM